MSDAAGERAVIGALHTVVDPELGLDVVDLGLVYEVRLGASSVHVRMTMTTPSCPFGGELAREAAEAIRRDLPELGTVDVELVWEPPWTPDRLSPHAKELLGWGR